MKVFPFLFVFLTKIQIMSLTNDQFQALIISIRDNLNLNKIGASGGSVLYNDGSAHTGLSVSSIYVRESSVVSAMTGVDSNGAAVNFITLFNISGVTLILGDLFIAPAGYRINAITLTSGSIISYS